MFTRRNIFAGTSFIANNEKLFKRVQSEEKFADLNRPSKPILKKMLGSEKSKKFIPKVKYNKCPRGMACEKIYFRLIVNGFNSLELESKLFLI